MLDKKEKKKETFNICLVFIFLHIPIHKHTEKASIESPMAIKNKLIKFIYIPHKTLKFTIIY